MDLPVYPPPETRPKAFLPSNNPQELRSFQYFLRRTAPTLAGVFFTEFWFRDIPQACHAHSAVWHAVVSLGAADEGYKSRLGKNTASISEHQLVEFALQQYNSSVRCLIDLSSSTIANRQIALIVSAIFVHICGVQGLQNQALIHHQSGLKLLQEIQTEHRRPSFFLVRKLSYAPVPILSVQSILQNISIQAEALLGAELDVSSSSLAGSDKYNYWRSYRYPNAGLVATDTRRNQIIQACKAVESLFNNMMVFLGQPDVYRLLSEGDIITVTRLQRRFKPVLQNLNSTLIGFEAQSPDHIYESEKDATRVLRIFGLSCQTLMVPTSLKQVQERRAFFNSSFSEICNLATKVLENDHDAIGLAGNFCPDEVNFVPRPSLTQPLFMTAICAPLEAIRRRAIELLEMHPRREGLWDSLFAAKLALYLVQHREDCVISNRYRMVTDKLRNVAKVQVIFQGERKVKLILRDFNQWSTGASGIERLMEW